MNHSYFRFEVLGNCSSEFFRMETRMRTVNGHKEFFEVGFAFHFIHVAIPLSHILRLNLSIPSLRINLIRLKE